MLPEAADANVHACPTLNDETTDNDEDLPADEEGVGIEDTPLYEQGLYVESVPGEQGEQVTIVEASDGGAAQEQRVRDTLIAEGYVPIGATDTEVAVRLGMATGQPRADFVGYNTETNTWLLAESKGSDIEHAVDQLRNTSRYLTDQDFYDAETQTIEYRIYTNTREYDRLTQPEREGYRVRDGFLGYNDYEYQDGAWVWETVNGERIRVVEVAN